MNINCTESEGTQIFANFSLKYKNLREEFINVCIYRYKSGRRRRLWRRDTCGRIGNTVADGQSDGGWLSEGFVAVGLSVDHRQLIEAALVALKLFRNFFARSR
jgi:hypothetical protein